jgi:hypothetical protein
MASFDLTLKLESQEAFQWWLSNASHHRALLGLSLFSQQGTLNREALSSAVNAGGPPPLLLCDRSPAESAWDETIAHLDHLLSSFPQIGLRCSDPGLLRWVHQHHPCRSVEFDLAYRFRNHLALRALTTRFEGMALSFCPPPELPFATLRSWKDHDTLSLSLYLFGPLTLLTTPRTVLSAKEQPSCAGVLHSEETDRDFPFTANERGTVIALDRLLCVLQNLPRLLEQGFRQFWLDPQPLDLSGRAALLSYLAAPQDSSFSTLSPHLPEPRTRGFYRSNQTDRQFSKFRYGFYKQQTPERRLAMVLGTQGPKKDRKVVLHCFFRVFQGQRLRMVTPEGKSVAVTLGPFWQGEDRPLSEVSGGICLTSALPHACAGSVLMAE